jgi:hypothetical protein
MPLERQRDERRQERCPVILRAELRAHPLYFGVEACLPEVMHALAQKAKELLRLWCPKPVGPAIRLLESEWVE